MTLEQALFVFAAAIIGLLLGYIINLFTVSKKLATAEQKVALLSHHLETETHNKNELLQQVQESQETLQDLKLSDREKETNLRSLTAQHEALTQAYKELTHRFQHISTELTENKESLSSIRAQHAAEAQKVEVHTNHIAQQQLTLNRTQELLAQEKADLAAIDKKARGLEVTANEIEKNFKTAKQDYHELQLKHEQLQTQLTQISSEHSQLKTSLEERDISHKEKVAQLEENKQTLTKEFENLANKIFEEKGKTFTSTSKSSIDDMLKPFREQIEGFQKRVNEVHDATTIGNTTLNAEIKKVLDIGLKMSGEAHNLTTALKGNSQQRGAWGEAQLQRTLEMSGLIANAHYETQSSFKDSEGKQKQTDYLIKLPDNKHIIIDSKVSLIAYDKAIAAESDQEYTLAMAEHDKAIKKHIDDLSSKDYTNLVGMRSPSFVLMFMPIEPAYIEALKNNKDLFSYGYEKNIVLVSHTTLIPILRTVANLWVMEQSNKEAREISDRAGEIYNNVCILTERLHKLGNTMNTASKHYNDTVKALVGQQGLHGKVERFTQLSSKVSKSLPDIEPKHIDFETEKLNLIAEPIEEPTNVSSDAITQLDLNENSDAREPTSKEDNGN